MASPELDSGPVPYQLKHWDIMTEDDKLDSLKTSVLALREAVTTMQSTLALRHDFNRLQTIQELLPIWHMEGITWRCSQTEQKLELVKDSLLAVHTHIKRVASVLPGIVELPGIDQFETHGTTHGGSESASSSKKRRKDDVKTRPADVETHDS